MASHGVSWVPSVHVRFGDLDFIITTQGELAQAPATVQPLHSADLDAIADVLEDCSCTHRRPTPPGATSSSTSTTGG